METGGNSESVQWDKRPIEGFPMFSKDVKGILLLTQQVASMEELGKDPATSGNSESVPSMGGNSEIVSSMEELSQGPVTRRASERSFYPMGLVKEDKPPIEGFLMFSEQGKAFSLPGHQVASMEQLGKDPATGGNSESVPSMGGNSEIVSSMEELSQVPDTRRESERTIFYPMELVKEYKPLIEGFLMFLKHGKPRFLPGHQVASMEQLGKDPATGGNSESVTSIETDNKIMFSTSLLVPAALSLLHYVDTTHPIVTLLSATSLVICVFQSMSWLLSIDLSSAEAKILGTLATVLTGCSYLALVATKLWPISKGTVIALFVVGAIVCCAPFIFRSWKVMKERASSAPDSAATV